jgi:hypothetical protein
MRWWTSRPPENTRGTVSKEERQFLDELRDRSIAAAAEIMESLQRIKLLYEEITDDGTGNPLPRPRAGDFFYRLARFELEHASNVIRLGNSQAEMIFDHVRQLAGRSKGGAVSTSVVLLTPGIVNQKQVYVGAFDIKNTFSTEADTRFVVEPMFDSSRGGGGVTPTVRCGTGRVPPYQSARIEVTVPMDKVADMTLFGSVTVFLSADVERQVAKRAIKVRPAVNEPPRATPPEPR